MLVAAVFFIGGRLEPKSGVPDVQVAAVPIVIPLGVDAVGDEMRGVLKHLQLGTARLERNGAEFGFGGHAVFYCISDVTASGFLLHWAV